MREEFLRRVIALVGRKFSKCLIAEVAFIGLAYISLLKFDGNKFDVIVMAIMGLALGYGALNIWQQKKNGEK